MRILVWHGWLLDGSGSNVYTARTAEVYRRLGHDVLLICQERHPERYPFIDRHGTIGPGGVGPRVELGALGAAGSLTLLRPQIGSLLPVFVVDEYEGFDAVVRFVDLTGEQLGAYLDRNVAAVKAAVEWFHPEAVIAGHAMPGSVVAARVRGPGGFVAKVHGSDLEYAIKLQDRYRDLAREGLSAARTVIGATRDVLERTIEFVPEIAGRTAVVTPGVEVGRFRPLPRAQALELAAVLLEADPDTLRGRPEAMDRSVWYALGQRDAPGLDQLARQYDQSVPDPGAAARLRALAAHRGPLIGYFGKLIPQKGVELFLQALSLGEGSVRGLVIGFGSFREWLAALVRAMDLRDPHSTRWLAKVSPMRIEVSRRALRGAGGLGDRLSFTGRLDHRYAPAALAALDVLVVPSVANEAFGMVAAEGAGAGALPLVAGHSGLAEVAATLEVAVDRPGLFSYRPGPGAVKRIAQGLDRLLNLPEEERARLRNDLGGFVAREWAWERTAQRLLDAATGRPPPGSPGRSG